MLALRMTTQMSKNTGDYEYLMNLIKDYETGTIENIPVDVLTQGFGQIRGYKVKSFDPDTPTMTQAMGGPTREEFRESMGI